MTAPHDPTRHDAARRDATRRDSHAESLARATDENSGHMVEGDTPPAEGVGVGPTNPQMDVETPGERSKGKLILWLLIALVVIGLLLAVFGRIASIGG